MTEDENTSLALLQQLMWPFSIWYFSLYIFWYVATRHAFGSAPSLPEAGPVSDAAVALTGQEQGWPFGCSGGRGSQLTHIPYACCGQGSPACQWAPQLLAGELLSVSFCGWFLWHGVCGAKPLRWEVEYWFQIPSSPHLGWISETRSQTQSTS